MLKFSLEPILSYLLIIIQAFNEIYNLWTAFRRYVGVSVSFSSRFEWIVVLDELCCDVFGDHSVFLGDLSLFLG